MTRRKKRVALFTLLIFAMTLLVPIAAQAGIPTVAFEPIAGGDSTIRVTLSSTVNGDTIRFDGPGDTPLTKDEYLPEGATSYDATLRFPAKAGEQYRAIVTYDSASGVPKTVTANVTVGDVNVPIEKAGVQFKNTLYIGDTSVRVHVDNATAGDVLQLTVPKGTSLNHTLTSAEANRGYIDFNTAVVKGTYRARITGGATDSTTTQSRSDDFVADASRIDANLSDDPYEIRENVPISLYLHNKYGRFAREATGWVYVWAEEVNTNKISPALYDPSGNSDRGVVTLRVTNGQVVDYPVRFDTAGKYIFNAALENPHRVDNPVLFKGNTSTSRYITVGHPGYTGYTMDFSYNGITQRGVRDGETAGRAMAVTPKATGTLVEMTLLDQRGRAVRDAKVNLSTDSGRIWLDRNSAITDGNGRVAFRVSGDAPGTYEVALRADGIRTDIPVEVTEDVFTSVHAIDLSFEGQTVKNLKAGQRADRTVPVITRSNGTPVTLTAYDENGRNVGSGQHFTITTNNRNIWVDNIAINTDGQGTIDFRVYGDTLGDYEVILRSGDNRYRLPVQVRLAGPGGIVKSALLTINNNTIITDNTIKDIDSAPVIREARTFVPYRAVAEAFGAQVVWNENARQVTMVDRGKTIIMTIGSNT